MLRHSPASPLGVLYAESGQTLEGSFSAVSKPNLASKYSLELARWKALDEIYKIYMLLHLGDPIETPRRLRSRRLRFNQLLKSFQKIPLDQLAIPGAAL